MLLSYTYTYIYYLNLQQVQFVGLYLLNVAQAFVKYYLNSQMVYFMLIQVF